jgi:hypothetical protein
MKLKFFFANFQILGPLGCQGWVVKPQNVKKRQNHCTLMYNVYMYAVHSCTLSMCYVNSGPTNKFYTDVLYFIFIRNIIPILMEYDANITMKDSQGQSAYDHASGNRKVGAHSDLVFLNFWKVNNRFQGSNSASLM